MKDRLRDTVETYYGFNYNENRVCINPQVLLSYKHGRNYGPNFFEISMSKYKDGKLYGNLHWWIVDGGYFGGAYVGNAEEGFDNENELIYHYLLELERDLDRTIKNSKTEEFDDNGNIVSCTTKIRELKHFLGKVGEYKDLYNPKQLTLF